MDDERALRELYAAHYARLVGTVGAICRDRDEAEEAVLRHGPLPDVAPPSGVAVDLRRALAGLPRTQREAVLLHSLGLDVAGIARELGVPFGTVKSRLSRARAALAPLLREDVNDRV